MGSPAVSGGRESLARRPCKAVPSKVPGLWEFLFSHSDQFLYDAKKMREKRGSGEEAGKKDGWLLTDDKWGTHVMANSWILIWHTDHGAVGASVHNVRGFMNWNTSMPDTQGNKRSRHRAWRERRNYLSVYLLVILERASPGAQEESWGGLFRFWSKVNSRYYKDSECLAFHGGLDRSVFIEDSHYKTPCEVRGTQRWVIGRLLPEEFTVP